jgi:hypothetical protein
MMSHGKSISVGLSLFCLASCSLIADPDQFKYKEGSASDDINSTDNTASDVETDSDSKHDTATDTSSDSFSDTGPGSDSDVAIETEASPNVGAVCQSNDDCTGGTVCPILFNSSNIEESESYCYLTCDDSKDACLETVNPLCYQHASGAVCLTRAALDGNFSCRAAMATDTNQLDLKIRPDDATVRLEKCEMFSSDGGFGFVFSTVTDGGILEATLFIPDLNLGDLQAGRFTTAQGEIRLNVLNSESSLTASTLLGFFPSPDISQVPPLDREIQIENVMAAGPIQGSVNFDGFAYDAKLRI